MLDVPLHFFTHFFTLAQAWLFEQIVQPIVFAWGWADYTDMAFDGTELFLLGVLEIALIYILIRPLEWWRPVMPLPSTSSSELPVMPLTRARQEIRVDILYTLLHRLGGIALILFFALQPVYDIFATYLHQHGITPVQLDAWMPENRARAVFSFVLYLIVLDFFDYWIHRAQHQFNWWWALHSLHHSQRYMTLWTDDRNHLLDDVIRSGLFALIALLMGVAPAQFVALLAVSRMLQNLQHANARVHFGVFERCLVSPRFHRLHHAIGVGHESRGMGTLGGHNFAVLLPLWDVLFGTAQFSPDFPETGIRDQLQGRNYGQGFWQQQWLGIQRLWRAS